MGDRNGEFNGGMLGGFNGGVGGDGEMAKGVDKDYFVAMVRKLRLSQWLSTSCKKMIEKEITSHQQSTNNTTTINNNTDNDDDDGYTSFSYMTGHMVNRAVQSALSIKDYNLSLLLSQCNDNNNKMMLRQQLVEWIDTKVDVLVSDYRVMLLSMLSGVLVLKCNKKQLNCCQLLDWKRCFALHLW